MENQKEKEDRIIAEYAKVWKEHGESLADIPLPEVDLKKVRKWQRRSPRRKMLRREVACLIAAVVMLAWFLFYFSKGMEMPVAYLMTLLLALLCVADSVYAIRLITLIDPITSTIPDMLKNCAKLRLYQKIELLVALVVVMPMSVFFMLPAFGWIWKSLNFYSDVVCDTFSWAILLAGVPAGVLGCIYMYRSNLRFIKGTINELRTYRNQL